MKRIKAACMFQTIHFMLKENLEHDEALIGVREDLERYKAQLNRLHTKFQITDEAVQPDGSIIIRIKKQYNSYNCDEYMD